MQSTNEVSVARETRYSVLIFVKAFTILSDRYVRTAGMLRLTTAELVSKRLACPGLFVKRVELKHISWATRSPSLFVDFYRETL